MASDSYGSLSSTKLVLTWPCSNQYRFTQFSAHYDILIYTKTKKNHKHIVCVLHFYQICALNVLIYEKEKISYSALVKVPF